MNNKDKLSNQFKIINRKPIELTPEIITSVKSVADQLEIFGDIEAARCIRFLLEGWSSLVQGQGKPVALRTCFNGTWFYAPWVDDADITAEWEPLYAPMKDYSSLISKNQNLEELLVRNMSNPELHKEILNGFSGTYTLGIGQDPSTGKPNFILMIPDGTTINFVKSIILEGVEFEIITEYSLKNITPL